MSPSKASPVPSPGDSFLATTNSEGPSNKGTIQVTDDLEERRRRIHDRITKHFKRKVSNFVFKNHPSVIQRSDTKRKKKPSSQHTKKTENTTVENEVYRLYQVLEDLETELKIANSKIKSYFVGLGVRIRNARRELRLTMESAKTPAILALCNSDEKAVCEIPVEPSKNNFNSAHNKHPRKTGKRKNDNHISSSSTKLKRSVRFSPATSQESCASDSSKKEEDEEKDEKISTDNRRMRNLQNSYTVSQLKSCMKRNVRNIPYQHHNHHNHRSSSKSPKSSSYISLPRRRRLLRRTNHNKVLNKMESYQANVKRVPSKSKSKNLTSPKPTNRSNNPQQKQTVTTIGEPLETTTNGTMPGDATEKKLQ